MTYADVMLISITHNVFSSVVVTFIVMFNVVLHAFVELIFFVIAVVQPSNVTLAVFSRAISCRAVIFFFAPGIDISVVVAFVPHTAIDVMLVAISHGYAFVVVAVGTISTVFSSDVVTSIVVLPVVFLVVFMLHFFVELVFVVAVVHPSDGVLIVFQRAVIHRAVIVFFASEIAI